MKWQLKLTTIVAWCALAICSGCVSRYQHETDQALLLQENQKLEQALYLTHYRLADAERENTILRDTVRNDDNSSTKSSSGMVIEAPRRRRVEGAIPVDNAPSFAPPQIPATGGSHTPPSFLQSPNTIPPAPNPSIPSTLGKHPKLAGNVSGNVPTMVIDNSATAPVSSSFPQWQPTR